MSPITRFKDMLVRNWREKIIALVLAFLFWFMIKAQITQPQMPQWQQHAWPPRDPSVAPTIVR